MCIRTVTHDDRHSRCTRRKGAFAVDADIGGTTRERGSIRCDPSAECKFSMDTFESSLSPESKLVAPLPDEPDEDFVPQEQVW
jgi:hypothetical protein